jgi:hypothetical protein
VGTVLAEDVTAIQQMNIQRDLQAVWADNAVSVTIYIHSGELEQVKEYLRENWSTMKSISFLLHSEHGFDQAPLEEITEGEYLEMRSHLTNNTVDLQGGMSELLDDDCVNGSCPTR